VGEELLDLGDVGGGGRVHGHLPGVAVDPRILPGRRLPCSVRRPGEDV